MAAAPAWLCGAKREPSSACTQVLDFIDQMEQRQQMKLAAAVFIQRGYRSWSKAVAMTSSKVETIQLMARDIE
jgi:hypothetical protein